MANAASVAQTKLDFTDAARPEAATEGQGDVEQDLGQGVGERVRGLGEHRCRTGEHPARHLGQRDPEVEHTGHDHGVEALRQLQFGWRLLGHAYELERPRRGERGFLRAGRLPA